MAHHKPHKRTHLASGPSLGPLSNVLGISAPGLRRNTLLPKGFIKGLPGVGELLKVPENK